MKVASWSECLETNSIRSITPDLARAKSLIETANQRISLVKEINQINCNFVFEDYYTSFLEILQAHAFKKGFNIMNHICAGFYLRDHLKREDLFRIFDDCRYKRNSLTYYGLQMDFQVAKDAIDACKELILAIQNF